jgi:hypothetical protein
MIKLLNGKPQAQFRIAPKPAVLPLNNNTHIRRNQEVV